MNRRTRKHHYLPRHYLRGFTDSEGCFFVYDKLNGKIFRASPDATFFENDLNTVSFPDGSRSDFLENLYPKMEGHAWQMLDNIRNSNQASPIFLKDKMNLFLFLSFLHWRLPSGGTLQPEFTVQYCTAIIERARRFVACHHDTFLAALISHHDIYVRFGKTDRIVPELFEMLARHKMRREARPAT